MRRRNAGRNLLARLAGRSPRYLAQFAALKLSSALNARELEFPLLPEDLADSAALRSFDGARQRPTEQTRVAWLAIPPSAGSGGHTTQFRMMQASVRAGIHTTLLLYDRHRGDFARNAGVIREAWPWMTADIQPVQKQIVGFDAVVATSWPTAHVVATRATQGRRLYFVQDYEPFFIAHGAEYALAQDSYRFGFRNIALGHMVQDLLTSEIGADSDFVPFGCDTDVYGLRAEIVPRSGIVFYAKRGNDRRGFTLAMRAIAAFHAACPEEPIHIYGDVIDDAPFPAIQHGNLAPDALNELYNTVLAGLALSFTNISLVAEEMLAAGVIPIVNDSPLARADLPNPHASWARATPVGLADALTAAVRQPNRDDHAATVGASVTGRSWRPSQEATVAILFDELSRVGLKRTD